MVLAGGEGRRLFPLTLDRAKPAVPFGGRYRIIDIVLSNFVNSGLSRIKVLTQYKSASLEEHIARVWRLSPILDQFIEAIPAQQRTGKSWFRGSADAVYQCQHVITDESPELVCIFGGDHVYKMDVRQMIVFHQDVKAEATVAAIPVPRAEARDFGVIEVDDGGRIVAFHEKVENPPSMPGNEDMCLASMGNYIFGPDLLLRELDDDENLEESQHDFGHDILPRMLVKKGGEVFAYDFATNRVPGEEEHGQRLLARHRHHRRLLGGADGPHRDPPAVQPLQLPLADPHGRHARPAGQVRLPRRGARPRRHRDRLAGQPRLHHLRRAHPPERPRRRLPRELVQRGRGERPLRGRAHRPPRARFAAPSSTRTSRSRQARSSASTARPIASASS